MRRTLIKTFIMIHISSKTKKSFLKAFSVTTSVTTALMMMGTAFLTPLTTHAAVAGIKDGDIFRASNDYKVYIAKYVGAKMFKRWFVGPQMFDFYKHLSFAVVKVVDPSVAAQFTESKLVRVDGDQKVWYVGNAVAGSGADKEWIPDLATFQNAGFDWDSVYVINSAEGNWYSMGGNYNGAMSPNPSQGPVAGSISASLAADNPAGSVIPGSTIYNTVLKVTFWAPASGGATISGVTLTKGGFLANTSVASVSAWDGSNRLGAIATALTSDGKVTLGFGSTPVMLGAGQSKTLAFAIGLTSAATSGTVSFGIAQSSDIQSNAAVSGSFPLSGNLFSITSSSGSLAAYTVSALGASGTANSTDAGNVDVGALQQQVGVFQFAETSGVENMQLESLTLYVEGSIVETTDVLNWKLYDVNNNVLATASGPVGRYVTFNLATPYVVAEGTTKTLYVKADFMNGSSRSLRVHVQNDYDVMVRGVSSRAFIAPTSFTDQYDNTSGWFVMRQGTLSITKASDSPSSQVTQGQTDALLAKFTLRAQGEDMELRKIGVSVATTTNAMALSGNLSIRSADGSVTYLTISSAPGSSIYSNGAFGTQTSLSTYVQLKSNADTVFTVYGNINANAPQNGTYQVSIGNAYVRRLSSLDYQNLATGGASGSVLSTNGTSASVSVAKNTSYGDNTVPPGLSGAKIGSFVVQGGTSEDLRMTNLALAFSPAWKAGVVQNLAVKVNGVQQGSTVSSPSTSANTTYSVNVLIPKSTPVVVDIYADVKTTATSSTFNVQLPANSVTMVGQSTGNTVTPSLPASPLTLQTITAGAGTLAITKDSSSPTEQILTPNSGVLLGNWKFAAQNEDLTMTKVTFSVKDGLGALNTAPFGNFGALYLKNGSTTLATGSLVNNDVIFGGFTLVIPASGNVVLSLYSDLTGSGVQVPGSIAVWTLKSTTTPTDINVTGSSGELDATAGFVGGPLSYFATSTRFLYHNSKPVIAAATNTPTGSGHIGQLSDTLFIFTVTNSGTRDMRIGSLSVTESASGLNNGSTAGVKTYDLYDGTQKVATNSTTAKELSANTSSAVVNFDVNNDISGYFDNFVISAGASKTLTVKADTSAITTGLSAGNTVSLTSKINGTTGAASGSAWNTGDLSYFYTPVFGTEQGGFSQSDSYPVNGGTLQYTK